jgi:hypothetical protein
MAVHSFDKSNHFCNNNKFIVIATLSFRFDLFRQIAGLLFFICYLATSDGLAADAVVPPLKGSVLEAPVLEASVSLIAARKTRSDPRIAAGHYFDAAEAAVLFQGVSSDNKVSEESRAIYKAAVQEVTVLLRSSAVHTIVADRGKGDTPNNSDCRTFG